MQSPTIDKIVLTRGQRLLALFPNVSPVAARNLFLFPLFIASAAVLFVSANSVYTRLSKPFPLDWWESMFIVDAARAIHGQPVYEKVGAGHATHMYGPLGTYTMAAIYRVTGVIVNAGRWLALIGGIGSTLLFVLAFVEKRTLVYLLIGTAFFVSLHIRCVDLFTNTRPDAFAFLLSTIALLAAYRAVERAQPIWYLVTASLTVIAFLYKQPYAVTALVPPLAVFFIRPRAMKRQLITSFIPLAMMVVAGITLKLGFRNVWFYMVTVPRLYGVSLIRMRLGIECLFMYNTIYLAIVSLIVLGAGIEHLRDSKTKWLFASMIIGGGMGILAFAKHGGTYNSLLMVYAPAAAFCMLKLPQAVEVMMTSKINLITRAVCSVSLAFMLTGTAFGTPLMWRLAFDHASNTEDFAKAV
ncbi:MAG TPA: hypothetical protein VHD56_11885, partial [Tepidisphaeraceae bacterium]|nr:hypothetical protein [Tepidisphaeraceae bacterium]